MKQPISLVSLLSLVMIVAALATWEDVSASGKKNKKKTKKSGYRARNCKLRYGMTEHECASKALTCHWNWVGGCDADSGALPGNGGCQLKGNCNPMRCPSTCKKNGCTWDAGNSKCVSTCEAVCAADRWDGSAFLFLQSKISGCSFTNSTANAYTVGAMSMVDHPVNSGVYSYKFRLGPGYGLIPPANFGAYISFTISGFPQIAVPVTGLFAATPLSVVEFVVNSTLDSYGCFAPVQIYANGVSQLNLSPPATPGPLATSWRIAVAGGSIFGQDLSYTQVC